MPYHKRLDRAKELHLDDSAIGTTGRGIGPSYIDKYGRSGIRVADLLNRDVLRRKLKRNIEEKNAVLREIYGAEELDVDKITEEYVEFDQLIDPYVTDTSMYLNDALRDGKHVLAEGAQGCLLDVDFGTYPFVTSSNPTVGGCLTGLGVPPQSIERVIGVTKAYTTRVGNGPFPTELDDELGERLRTAGSEFGATTGRPRRCGWLDLVALRYAAMINGMTHLAITKLDVLNGFDGLQAATGYELRGRSLARFPSDSHDLAEVQPQYDRFEGWQRSVDDASYWDELPDQARSYLEFVSDYVGIPISHVSTGPRRSETIKVEG